MSAAVLRKVTTSSCSACKNWMRARRFVSSAPSDRDPLRGDTPMRSFNLSAWAVRHPALLAFFILALGVAGTMSFLKLGRAEDPNFTIKNVVITAIWPGATATEMQSQVSDRIEKKLQELPYF